MISLRFFSICFLILDFNFIYPFRHQQRHCHKPDRDRGDYQPLRAFCHRFDIIRSCKSDHQHYQKRGCTDNPPLENLLCKLTLKFVFQFNFIADYPNGLFNRMVEIRAAGFAVFVYPRKIFRIRKSASSCKS